MKTAKKTKAAKAGKKTKKLPAKLSRFFGNKKLVVVAVFVLAFAGFGSYRLYTTSAATTKSVITCWNQGVVLRRGSTGPCVVTVQKLMKAFRNVHDSSWPDLAVDGKYGPITETAVRKYQQQKRISVDGVVGPQTWRALDNDCIYYYRNFQRVYSGCDYSNK